MVRVPGGREQSTIINTLVSSQDGVESHEVVDKQTNFSVTDTHTDTHRPFYNKTRARTLALVLAGSRRLALVLAGSLESAQRLIAVFVCIIIFTLL